MPEQNLIKHQLNKSNFPASEGLISVIIPCYNQAHYLGEAIESVLAQSYPYIEILVIDDGSPDNTAEIATKYPQVRYIRQENQGLSGARNTGIKESTGKYLVFLDADDRLIPDGLQVGINCFLVHPECAFVSGHHRYIKGDGSLLNEYPQEPIDDDPYLALLKDNYIGMCATVMYQRQVFETVGNFKTTLKSCEDYDLYLRIARQFPVARHSQMVAEYRWHEANMTNNAKRMLQSALTALGSQWEYVQQQPPYIKAYQTGMKFWRNYFGQRLLEQMGQNIKKHQWKALLQNSWQLIRYCPLWTNTLWQEFLIAWQLKKIK